MKPAFRWLACAAAAAACVSAVHAQNYPVKTVRFVVTYPAALYRSMRWWVAVGVAFALVGLVVGVWVAGDPHVQATIAAPDEIRQLVDHDFEDYYSSAPAGSFAAQVATNNAWVSALALLALVLVLFTGRPARE